MQTLIFGARSVCSLFFSRDMLTVPFYVLYRGPHYVRMLFFALRKTLHLFCSPCVDILARSPSPARAAVVGCGCELCAARLTLSVPHTTTSRENLATFSFLRQRRQPTTSPRRQGMSSAIHSSRIRSLESLEGELVFDPAD